MILISELRKYNTSDKLKKRQNVSTFLNSFSQVNPHDWQSFWHDVHLDAPTMIKKWRQVFKGNEQTIGTRMYDLIDLLQRYFAEVTPNRLQRERLEVLTRSITVYRGKTANIPYHARVVSLLNPLPWLRLEKQLRAGLATDFVGIWKAKTYRGIWLQTYLRYLVFPFDQRSIRVQTEEDVVDKDEVLFTPNALSWYQKDRLQHLEVKVEEYLTPVFEEPATYKVTGFRPYFEHLFQNYQIDCRNRVSYNYDWREAKFLSVARRLTGSDEVEKWSQVEPWIRFIQLDEDEKFWSGYSTLSEIAKGHELFQKTFEL